MPCWRARWPGLGSFCISSLPKNMKSALSHESHILLLRPLRLGNPNRARCVIGCRVPKGGRATVIRVHTFTATRGQMRCSEISRRAGVTVHRRLTLLGLGGVAAYEGRSARISACTHSILTHGPCADRTAAF